MLSGADQLTKAMCVAEGKKLIEVEYLSPNKQALREQSHKSYSKWCLKKVNFMETQKYQNIIHQHEQRERYCNDYRSLLVSIFNLYGSSFDFWEERIWLILKAKV